MLILSRKRGESVQIGGGVSVTVVKISGGGVRLGINAPEGTEIVREELLRAFGQAQDVADEFEAVSAD
ncbi:MAG: carbon storage regulator [Pirellulales bacterium]|nr:carbon storage regulator [Pirellulales bacterium]